MQRLGNAGIANLSGIPLNCPPTVPPLFSAAGADKPPRLPAPAGESAGGTTSPNLRVHPTVRENQNKSPRTPPTRRTSRAGPVDLEPPEELAPPLEDVLEGRDHERLAEPPRARDEEELPRAGRDEPVEVVRLVDVHAVSTVRRTQVGEVIGVLGNRFHMPYYTTKNVSS